MRLIPKIFLFDEEDVPAEMRAQRTLNKSRIPAIADYLLGNNSDYTLPAITASISKIVEFASVPLNDPTSNIGTLFIPMDAKILINDGQHRRAAIEIAIQEQESLGHDSIPVLFFIDEDLKRSQQMFADLNKHAVRPSNSLSTLYDHRDPGSELARYVVGSVECFKRLTELEKSSISNRSTKLFTLSSIKLASRTLLGKKQRCDITLEEMKLASNFWNSVCDNMPDWQKAETREIAPSELRQNFVHAHGVALHALGHVGTELIQYPSSYWEKHLGKLARIDWSRANTVVWEGRAMQHGRISKAQTNIRLTTSYIKSQIGLPLSQDELELESQLSHDR